MLKMWCRRKSSWSNHDQMASHKVFQMNHSTVQQESWHLHMHFLWKYNYFIASAQSSFQWATSLLKGNKSIWQFYYSFHEVLAIPLIRETAFERTQTWKRLDFTHANCAKWEIYSLDTHTWTRLSTGKPEVMPQGQANVQCLGMAEGVVIQGAQTLHLWSHIWDFKIKSQVIFCQLKQLRLPLDEAWFWCMPQLSRCYYWSPPIHFLRKQINKFQYNQTPHPQQQQLHLNDYLQYILL